MMPSAEPARMVVRVRLHLPWVLVALIAAAAFFATGFVLGVLWLAWLDN